MIDSKIAAIILDELGFTLQDLSLEYGDVCIADGDISHQLYYESIYSSANVYRYIYKDGDIYYTDGFNNFSSPELAALDCVTESDRIYALNRFYAKQLAVDYI